VGPKALPLPPDPHKVRARVAFAEARKPRRRPIFDAWGL